MKVPVVIVGAALVVVTGCIDTVEVARLRYEQGQPLIAVPTSGAINEPLEAVVMSEAGACDDVESTVVERTNVGVIITPYVRVEQGECNSSLHFLEHRATVSFAEAGDHTIIVRGRVGANILELPYTVTIE